MVKEFIFRRGAPTDFQKPVRRDLADVIVARELRVISVHCNDLVVLLALVLCGSKHAISATPRSFTAQALRNCKSIFRPACVGHQAYVPCLICTVEMGVLCWGAMRAAGHVVGGAGVLLTSMGIKPMGLARRKHMGATDSCKGRGISTQGHMRM